MQAWCKMIYRWKCFLESEKPELDVLKSPDLDGLVLPALQVLGAFACLNQHQNGSLLATLLEYGDYS